MSSFCKCKSYSHFFSKNFNIYTIFNDKSFNDTLSNKIVSLNNWALIFFLFLKKRKNKKKTYVVLIKSAAEALTYVVGTHLKCLKEVKKDKKLSGHTLLSGAVYKKRFGFSLDQS